jgi:hypothetical protein
MKKIIIVLLIGFTLIITLLYMQNTSSLNILSPLSRHHWEVQSVDTMKYSRDTAREKLNDPSFDTVIDGQMANIAATGANYVAIGTPYDEEFYPFLKRWVEAARRHNLHVWFRGNFSGWEGWFGYPRITREMHIVKTQEFILNNRDLFEDGDIFTSCPECENGIKIEYGDPKSLAPHRDFLIKEYQTVKNMFFHIGLDVKANYYSMNGDVAKAMMDKPTTAALDGIVVIDHYVKSPTQLAEDVQSLAEHSGGSIVLGEFGAPIPDIHGKMSEEEQARWMDEALQLLVRLPEVKGVNYWVNMGGSTELWSPNGQPKLGVSVLKKYYSHKKLF